MAELVQGPDAYHFWRSGLAGLTLAVQDGNPQPGFYRARQSKGGPWQPVAIWAETDGSMVALRGSDSVDAADIWIACARHPVSYEDYQHALQTGDWPGALPAPADTPRAVLTDVLAPAPIGDNNPPEGSEALLADIDERVAEAKSWADGRVIASQADADRAEALISALAKAGKAAEAAHKGEKAPHLEAGRKVDARWKPVLGSVEGTVRLLKGLLTPFLRAREEEKRAAAAKAIAAGAEPVRADTRATTSGTHGRKVTLRRVKRAKVTDAKAALAFFADHPEITALVQRLADKVVSVGGSVPGVEVVTEESAA